MHIKPIGNRAVIKLSKVKTTKSGIIIALDEKNEQAIGEIIAIGNGSNTSEGNITELGLKIGDKVLVSKYGGETVQDEIDESIEYKIILAKDLIAVIN